MEKFNIMDNIMCVGGIMRKVLRNVVFICALIFIALLIFNIVNRNIGYGYFSKAALDKESVVFSRDSNVKYADINSYKIENKDYNNSIFYKTINVKRNTPYKITCMIKTEDVSILDESVNDSGAQISILNLSEQSQCIRGTEDWKEVSLIFNSKQKEELKVGFMLGGSSKQGNVKGTAWFSDFKIEEGSLDIDNNWNFACFIFKNTDVNISDCQYKYQMFDDDVNQIYDCINRFKEDCSILSNNFMTASCDIIELDNPITNLSYDEEHKYYIDPINVSSYIDEYLSKNCYDHIFICAKLSDEMSSVPINDWIGLGSMEYKGIGVSNIRISSINEDYSFQYDKGKNEFPEEVFVHEFLHTLEKNSIEYGYEVPKLHDNQKYGYKKDNIYGLYDWYKDYMNETIQYEQKYIGLNSKIYMYRPTNENNFYNSKILNDFEENKNIFKK